jgi:hypothetical protein
VRRCKLCGRWTAQVSVEYDVTLRRLCTLCCLSDDVYLITRSCRSVERPVASLAQLPSALALSTSWLGSFTCCTGFSSRHRFFLVFLGPRAGHEISGLNPVARSESLAAIFSRTDLIQKKKQPNAYRQTKIFGRQWRPGDRKFRALS